MKKKSDVTEWLYVLEINPGQRVKVGRTTDLRARLTTHSANVDFGGGEVTQVYTTVCPSSRAAEFELIARLAARPDAEVVMGREMFAGVRFRAAVDLADAIARQFRRKVAASDAAAPALPSALLADCLAAFGDDDRLHLEDLRTRLADAQPGIYGRLTVLTMGSALRDVGIRSRDVRLGSAVRKGLYASDFPELRPGETSTAG